MTGSCYLLETMEARVLIDCGMFQGGAVCESKNFAAFEFDPKTIDAVVVTHAHLDHTGRLPKLVKEGFRGKIYLTPPTCKLAEIVLEDAYHLMLEDFKRQYRPMLYQEEDITATIALFAPLDYNRRLTIGDLSFRFREAGHIFGSAFVEIEERAGGRVTFSGDLGNEHVPILRSTAQLAETDIVVMESTYGDRVHEDESTRETKLKAFLQQTADQKGVLLIPAFAIERTQQLLFEMNHLIESGLVPPIPAYLDSPMAIKATEIVKQFPQYYDRAALELVTRGDDMFDFPGLHLAMSRDESKAINEAPRPKVIISGSGMMNGGRILHHLVRYLSDPSSTLLIVGYQNPYTLGGRLYRGDTHVTVLGERVEVRARIASIGAYSAHADQAKLVSWIASAAKKPARVFCTHGDPEASQALAERLRTEIGIDARAPQRQDMIQL